MAVMVLSNLVVAKRRVRLGHFRKHVGSLGVYLFCDDHLEGLTKKWAVSKMMRFTKFSEADATRKMYTIR